MFQLRCWPPSFSSSQSSPTNPGQRDTDVQDCRRYLSTWGTVDLIRFYKIASRNERSGFGEACLTELGQDEAGPADWGPSVRAEIDSLPVQDLIDLV